MANNAIFTTFLLLLYAALAKGHHCRLLLLAVAGLAGMYMVHLLAGDYNTYQQQQQNRPQRPQRFFFCKRSALPQEVFGRKDVADVEEAADALVKRDNFSNDIAKLDTILRFDPTGCARRYVCTIATKSQKKLTPSERNVIHMLRTVTRKELTNSPGRSAFRDAMELGRVTRDPESCTAEYPKCLFTTSQIIKLMNSF